jgi:acyl carrier protein
MAKWEKQIAEEALIQRLSEIMKTQPSLLKKSRQQPLNKLEFDSLIGVEMITTVAEEFGVELSPDVFQDSNQKKFISIAGILELLQDQIERGADK